MVKQCVVSGTIGVTLDFRRVNQGGSDPSTQFMVLLVWYIVFCVFYHHSPSFSVVGAVWVKMDRLPLESQEQLKKTENDRLRAKFMKAGYEEAQVEDMGRKELLDAMAKVTLNEDLMQEASQAPLPADESSSWTSEVGMEAARLRELEMEEKRAEREERKAIREAEERKAVREAEVRKAAMEAEARKAEAEERRAAREEAEERRAEREAKREQEKARMQLEQAKLAQEIKKTEMKATEDPESDDDGETGPTLRGNRGPRI